MDDINNLSTSLTNTLKNSSLQDVAIDISEATFDQVLDGGLVKDIPIIGTIVGLTRAALTIKDRLFTKKLIKFLVEIKDIPAKKRNKQIEKIDNDPNYRAKVGEKLLYIIEHCEDSEKAEMIGKIFRSFLVDKIGYDDFLRASTCIDRAHLPDLRVFINSSWSDLSIDEAADFVSAGLMEFQAISPIIEEDPSILQRDDAPPKYIVKNAELRCQTSNIGDIVRELLK